VEAIIVALASGVSSVFSVFFVIDAFRDKWLVDHAVPPRDDLIDVAFNVVIEEVIYLILNMSFFGIALITILTTRDILRTGAILLLVSLPIILVIRSFYRALRRKRMMRGENPRKSPKDRNGF
jgi:hypothetical protein